MDRLFNMDNKFFTVMGRVADLIMLNVVFLICCLPIVTIGASLTALHYVTLKMARNEESYIIRSFFKSFKQNFKQATVINLIMLAVATILYMDLRIVGNIDGTMSQVLYIVFFAFGILYMMVFLYIYPVLAKFYNSIKNTFRNAFLMAIRHLPYTVLMAVITLLPAGVFFIKSFRIQSMAIMLLCMFGFALEAFINGHFLVKIFDNYIPADADTQDTDLQTETLLKLHQQKMITQYDQWGENHTTLWYYMLRERFGEKVYKVTLNGGMSCPNRDGKIGTRGCIFCSAGGSGDFAADAALSITDQIESQISILSQKRPIHKYIAYFQAYTNTYAPVEYLEKIFTEAISHPKIVALSIGTRPDCLSPEIVTLLSRLNKQKPVWIELGLQTIHESTARYIRRGYPLCVFDDAVKRLRKENIEVIVHTILGLPGENTADILETMEYLNHMDIQGIKLQLLHVLRGTDLAADYEKGLFQTYERDEYISLLINCLEHLRPDMVIHRITGDGPKDLLIAPLWASRKREVLNMLHHRMKEEQSYQGRLFLH